MVAAAAVAVMIKMEMHLAMGIFHSITYVAAVDDDASAADAFAAVDDAAVDDNDAVTPACSWPGDGAATQPVHVLFLLLSCSPSFPQTPVMLLVMLPGTACLLAWMLRSPA